MWTDALLRYLIDVKVKYKMFARFEVEKSSLILIYAMHRVLKTLVALV